MYLEYVADLAAAAGVEFLRLFVTTGHMYANAGADPPDARQAKRFYRMPDGSMASSCLVATASFASSVRYRYWTRVAGNAGLDLPPSSRALARERAEALEAQLRADESLVYGVAESLECIDSFDLINSFFPGPRQFEKNATGLGPGQAE